MHSKCFAQIYKFKLISLFKNLVQCITDGKVLDDTTGYYWQAAVQDKADQWKVICVAAVITKSKLITSANCTYHRDHKTLQIRTESYKKTVYAGKHYDDLFIREHGGFDPVTLENNIAVIILRNQRFRFNNRLGKVILPKDQNLPKGEVTVVAWCNHQSKSSFKTDQAFVTATPKIVDLGTCNRKFDGVSDVQLTDENICSDYLGTGCRGLCIEDAGG